MLTGDPVAAFAVHPVWPQAQVNSSVPAASWQYWLQYRLSFRASQPQAG